jgi:hypothetical protein
MPARSGQRGRPFLFGAPTSTGARWFMYVIKRQHDNATEGLLSRAPEGWGARDHAMLFETRREAQRAAVTIKLSGDWSIDPGFWPERIPLS